MVAHAARRPRARQVAGGCDGSGRRQRWGLAPLDAADLLANWKTARSEYAEMAPDVLPEDPDGHLAFVKQYNERSRARIADLDFAMKNGIAPARLQG